MSWPGSSQGEATQAGQGQSQKPGVRLGRWGTGALCSSRERVPGQLARLEDAGTAALSG